MAVALRPRWLHWRHQYVRRLGGVFFGVLILIGPLGGLLYLSQNWPASRADQVALVGVVATVVTVWLAAVAAIVALLAYLLADESPDIAVWIVGAGPVADGIDFLLGQDLSAGRREILAPPQLDFRLENSSAFSARSPVLEVTLTDCYAHGVDSRWQVFRQTADDIAFQWSGGADISVHGKGRILTPPLTFANTGSWARENMTITVEVFADGFHLAPVHVPIRVQVSKGA